MMTLDEAIQHCEDVQSRDDLCTSCKEEHQQLADWLKDYKVLKERATPKKVIIQQYTPAYCPTCGEELSESWGDGYYKYYTHLDVCPNKECRQVLDWRYEEWLMKEN